MMETTRIAALPLMIMILIGGGLVIFLGAKLGKNRSAALAAPGLIAVIAGAIGGVFIIHLFGIAMPAFLFPAIIPGVLTAIVMMGNKKKDQKRPAYEQPRSKAVPVIVLMAGLLVAAVLGFFVTARVSHRPPPRQVVRPQAVEVPRRVDSGVVEPSIWHEGVVQQMQADVYPSKRAAVLALARRVADEGSIGHELADKQMSREILLLEDGHDSGMMNELAGVMTKLLSHNNGAKCRLVQGADILWDAPSGAEVVKQLQLKVRVMFEDVKMETAAWGGEVSSGNAVMQVKGPDSLTGTTVRFVEKPWAEDFTGFLNSHPQSQLLLAISNSACTSRRQAEMQALNDASARLTDMIRGMPTKKSILPVKMNVGADEVSSAGFIVDRFTQRLSGVASPVWREAILVDVSESRLAAFADEKTAYELGKRGDWAKMVMTLVGMFVLISLVYMFLNAATKGYYAWTLRVAVVVLLGIGVLLVLAFA